MLANKKEVMRFWTYLTNAENLFAMSVETPVHNVPTYAKIKLSTVESPEGTGPLGFKLKHAVFRL